MPLQTYAVELCGIISVVSLKKYDESVIFMLKINGVSGFEPKNVTKVAGEHWWVPHSKSNTFWLPDENFTSLSKNVN